MIRTLVMILLAATSLLFGGDVRAQLPVEAFAGDKKATFDALFFRYFRNAREEPSKFLFFSRTRASVDYKITKTTNLPAFGLTEAFSYNAPKLKGFAPVAVVQVLNRGVFAKAGIQYVLIQPTVTLFSWIVSETDREPVLDHFILFRYTPALGGKLRLFAQLETLSAFPTVSTASINLVQRFRLGLSTRFFQFGGGVDLTESGRTEFSGTQNTGLFLRYDFK